MAFEDDADSYMPRERRKKEEREAIAREFIEMAARVTQEVTKNLQSESLGRLRPAQLRWGLQPHEPASVEGQQLRIHAPDGRRRGEHVAPGGHDHRANSLQVVHAAAVLQSKDLKVALGQVYPIEEGLFCTDDHYPGDTPRSASTAW